MTKDLETIITAEVRWFWRGKPSEELIRDFFTGPYAAELGFSEPRTDDYFIFDRASTVGLKQREGKLELKALVEDAKGKISMPDFQIWEKRSVMEESSLDESLKFEEGWLSVTKARLLRRFKQIDDAVREVAPEQISGTNCQLEISAITCKDQDYWSYCLECYAEDGLPEKYFEIFYRHLSGNRLVPKATEESEPQSYPVFLSQLMRGQGI